ncbi:uncharacterized protein [Apostichopus japonicus]|uniref:uncharacterized protein isoform X1 n=1 Tax=Stichopus japonicus TaxID=307972 RepID=UPI003AB6B69F
MDIRKRHMITPVHTTQLPRFTGEGDLLCDMTVDSTKVAVSGTNEDTSFIDLFVLNIPDSSSPFITRFYSKEFKNPSRWRPRRCVSFLDDSRIVTVCDDQLDVFNIKTDDIPTYSDLLRDEPAKCMTIREEEIFIGLSSNKVIVFDFSLHKIKTITLEGLVRDYPVDITVYGDNLFISTVKYRAIRYNMEGVMLHEYNTPGYSLAYSITVSSEFGLVFVSCWSLPAVAVVVYSLSENHTLFTFRVINDWLNRIRINDVNRFMFTATRRGTLRVYSTASMLTFSHLKEELSSKLTQTDCGKLGRYFSLPPDQVKTIITSPSYSKNFLLALEERGFIHPSNVNRLTDALTELKINHTHLLTETYMKLRDQETEYDRFLAGLSAHLTFSITVKLCENFEVTDKNKNTVISSQNPGLSFLQTIDKMGIINPSDVSKLETPLEEYRLLQAVAKIHEYQSLVLSDETMPRDEDKESLFLKCLQQKMKSWFETMTPVPWMKSCQWKSNDLFIASRLVLTNSGSKISSREVDRKCKLHYLDIFTDERLKAETRIILEGQPGSGKTMLSSQLAYDWCCGKLMDIPIVIYLPLKIVDDMTIIQAIKKFYIRKGIPITEEDIESMLNSDKKKVYLILDGLEEYNGVTKDGSPSEVMRVMTKEELSNCIVIITARTDYAKHLPPGPMLKIGSFGEDERNEYIEKVYSDDVKRQEEVKELIDNVPFILDLCNVPLLFVLLVHNIDRLGKSHKVQLDRVTPFVKAVVDILCPMQDEEDKHSHLSGKKTYVTLEELAFNGLCKGNQQLFWQKDFVDRSVTNSSAWIDSGILVVEEGTPFNSTDRNLQTDSGSGTPQTDSISDESLNTSNVTSEMKRGASPDPDLSASVSQSESKPILESKEKKSKPLQKGKAAKYVSLQVKFLHKLIQEWFAAQYLALLFWGRKSTEHHYKYQLFREHLVNIDPADLHYVLRFTCHICPPSFHVIASFLMRDFKTGDGEIPDYIMNCICLCFAEYDGYKGHKVKDIVKEICRRESVNFSSGDNRLLLRSKVSMLTFASRSKIPIKCLKLSDVVEKITEKALILKADVSLGVLNTLRAIEVNRWDQKLIEQDYKDLIKFIINNEKVEVARLLLPSPPVAVKDEKDLNNLQSRNISVEWIIGANLIHTLNVTTGEWTMEFRLPGRMSAKSSSLKPISDNLPPNPLQMELWINKDGGVLEIPDTGVSLEIPPGALEKDQLIQMRIIPYNFQGDSDLSFSSNSSVVVELLPSHLKLLKPVKLTLPHCLVLKKGCEWKAKIYSSHHEEGTQPLWRPQPDTPYVLTERNCVIKLKNFSWEKFDIGDEIVEGKRIVLYAAKDLSSSESITHIHVGYYWELPGGEKIVSINEVSVLVKQSAVFFRKGQLPLKCLFDKIEPSAWTCGSEEENSKEISFIRVATSKGGFCTFVLNIRERKQESHKCTCYFKAGQGSELVELLFILKDGEEESAASSSNKVVDAGLSQSQKKTGVESLTVKQPLENIDPEVRTESLRDPSLPSHQAIGGEAEGNPAGAEAMTKDSEEVTIETLQDLSGNLFKEWRDVGRNLKLAETELDNIEADNRRKGQKQVVYHMLLLWKRKHGMEATNKTLRDALKAAKRKHLSDYLLNREQCGTTLDKTNKTVEQQEDKSSDISSKGKSKIESSGTVHEEQGSMIGTVEQQEDEINDVPSKGNSKIKASGTVHEEQGSMIGTDNLPSNPLQMELCINKDGGVLEIPDTGVSLEVPPGALEKDQLIQMRIIPYNFQGDSDLSFSSNSSVVVELLPSHLKLLKPVKLTLPHCLVLKKGCEWKAKIYNSNHEEGTQPLWRPQPDTPYELTERNCVIKLKNFSWKKFDIGDEIVEGKHIVLYAAKDLSSTESITQIHVGYYLELPGGEKIVSINEVSVLVKQCAVFFKQGELPLTCHFVNIEPPDWTCDAEGKKTKEISFKRVATSKGGFCTFVLNIKEGTQERHNCKCHFEAGQGADLVELRFILKDGGEDSAASSSDKLVDAGLSQSQKRTGDESLTAKQPIENIDLEVITESLRHIYLQDISAASLSGNPAPSQSADVPHSKKRRFNESAVVMDISASSLSGSPAPSQSADVPHSKKRRYNESTAAVMAVSVAASSPSDSSVPSKSGNVPHSQKRCKNKSTAEVKDVPMMDISASSLSGIPVPSQSADVPHPKKRHFRAIPRHAVSVAASSPSDSSVPSKSGNVPHSQKRCKNKSTAEVKDVPMMGVSTETLGDCSVPSKSGNVPHSEKRCKNKSTAEVKDVPMMDISASSLSGIPVPSQSADVPHPKKRHFRAIPRHAVSVAASSPSDSSVPSKSGNVPHSQKRCKNKSTAEVKDVPMMGVSTETLGDCSVPSKSGNVPHSEKRCKNKSIAEVKDVPMMDISASSLSGIPVPSQSADVPHPKKRHFRAIPRHAVSVAASSPSDSSVPSKSGNVPHSQKRCKNKSTAEVKDVPMMDISASSLSGIPVPSQSADVPHPKKRHFRAIPRHAVSVAASSPSDSSVPSKSGNVPHSQKRCKNKSTAEVKDVPMMDISASSLSGIPVPSQSADVPHPKKRHFRAIPRHAVSVAASSPSDSSVPSKSGNVPHSQKRCKNKSTAEVKDVPMMDISASSLSGIPVPSQSADVPHPKKRRFRAIPRHSKMNSSGTVHEEQGSMIGTGTHPLLEPQLDTPYELNERNCIWENVDIGDETVQGKRIVLYAAIHLSSHKAIVHIDVGYYLDLEGCEENVNMNKVFVFQKKPWFLFKKGRLPLKFYFVKTEPRDWNFRPDEGNPKEIPFDTAAILKGSYCTFVFNKKGTMETDKCSFYFKAGQESHLTDLTFELEDGGKDSAASSSEKLVDAGLSQSQKKTCHESQTVNKPIRKIDLEVSDKDLMDLSGKIPKEWKKVGRNLGLQNPELCILERDNNNQGLNETVYQMLLTWKHSNGSKATYRVLGEALIAAGRRDLQEMLYKQAGIKQES